MRAPAIDGGWREDGGTWAEATIGLVPIQGVADGFPVLSADELTLYFGSALPQTNGDFDVFVSTRTSTSAPFENRKRIDGLSQTGRREAPGFVSPDNCRLYFDAAVDDANTLWVAERKR